MDRAAHLKHLQTILQKFDVDMVILERILIRLFCNGLQLSIHAQTEQDGCQKNTWEQAIKKAIIAKAKTNLNFPSWVRKIDACYPWGHQSSSKADKHTKEKVFNRNFPRFQKSKSQPPQRSKNTETSDKFCKDHSNNRRNKKGRRDYGPCRPRHLGFTPATEVNTTNSSALNNRNRKRPSNREDKDMSQVTCYNCNKKRHFVNQFIKSHKPKN